MCYFEEGMWYFEEGDVVLNDKQVLNIVSDIYWIFMINYLFFYHVIAYSQAFKDMQEKQQREKRAAMEAEELQVFVFSNFNFMI